MGTPIDDAGRLVALRQAALLDTPPEEAFDRMTRLAGRITGAPITRVTLIDAQRQWFKSQSPAFEPGGLRETPISHSYCAHVVELGRPLRVPDAREHPLLRHNPAIQDYDAIAYLGVPLRGADGHVLGTLCALDTSPRAWSEDDLEALSELVEGISTELALRSTAKQLQVEQLELARSNRDLEGFATAVSHDLAEPLRTIRGLGQLLVRRHGAALDEEGRELVDSMLTAARRGGDLVADLLAYARAGHGKLVRGPVDSAEVAAEALESLAEVRADAHVVVGDLPTVDADRTQLRQVLQNLIGNALKYRGDGTPAVRVDAERETGAWRFSVADNGVGVQSRDRERIFELLYRAGNGAGQAGTGVGLALCRTVIERHGGRIWVDSEPGRGSTFHFTLPDAAL